MSSKHWSRSALVRAVGVGALSLGLLGCGSTEPDPSGAGGSTGICLLGSSVSEIQSLVIEPARIRGMAVGPTGNVVVAASFELTIDLGGGARTTATSQSEIIIASFAPGLVYQWDRHIAGVAPKELNLALGPDGSIVIAGTLSGSIDFGGGPRTGQDALYVAAYDPDGTYRWDRTFDSSSTPKLAPIALPPTGFVSLMSQFVHVTVAPGGAVAVTTRFDKATDFGGGLRSPLSNPAAIVLALDASGSYLWDDARPEIVPHGIGADVAGRVFALLNQDVVAFSASGTELWSEPTLSPAPYSVTDRRTLAVGPAGRVLSSGQWLASAGTLIDGSVPDIPSGSPVVIARDGETGAYAWHGVLRKEEVTSGPAGFLYHLAAGPSGETLAVGGFGRQLGFGDQTLQGPATGSDGFLATVDADGKPHSIHALRGADFDEAHRVAVDPTGHITVAGEFKQDLQLFDESLSTSTEAMFLMQLSPTCE